MFRYGAATAARHAPLPSTFDGGFSFSPKVNQKDIFTLAFDWRDALNATHSDTLRHGNVGFEYLAFKAVGLRAGYSQGYWTAGFGLNAKSGSIDLATYGEELTKTTFHGFGDRHYSLRLMRRF